ncbi:zinc finger protein 791 [Pieris rapae]|uniref:zinc finger protein 791 n=1 Tax=Pieris rapae TaxID=64459 RepID=UPI001E27CCB2|nr:zinc finger protein 791 [Pieris rapae]XP_045484615.1 zinc finger protein 791 [Pieris rapae]
MESETIEMVVEHPYPVLYVPKWCVTFEHDFGPNKNLFLDVDILSNNTDQQRTTVYKGYIALKVIDTKAPASSNPIILQNDAFLEADLSFNINNDRTWLNLSPCEYQSEGVECGPGRSLYQEPQFSYITAEHLQIPPTTCQEGDIQIAEVAEPVFLHKKFRKSTSREREDSQQNDNFNSQSSKNFFNENSGENQITNYTSGEINYGNEIHENPSVIDECRDSDNACSLKESIAIVENCALKQLMTDFASPKQNKVIVFAGDNSQNGQTIYQIKDSSLQCGGKKIMEDSLKFTNVGKKKIYQCQNCKQTFDKLKAFRQHASVHKKRSHVQLKHCLTCKRTFKSLEKFTEHALGHNDPDLECPKCYKVLRTKYTLRVHMSIHNRLLPCPKCTLTYNDQPSLDRHISRMHSPKFSCSHCGQGFKSLDALEKHKVKTHSVVFCNICKAEFNTEKEYLKHLEEHIVDNLNSDDNLSIKSVDNILKDVNLDMFEDSTIRGCDPVIQKIADDRLFSMNPQQSPKKRMSRVCIVCKKKFDRISDMKRHLIEHVIKRSLAKNPINEDGTLSIVCDICRVATFSRVDTYKAHLREHAKLTIYKCLLCDKSFSDSSNFSKHKKLHGQSHYECDLCKRKFNSKKTISIHMELHFKTPPLSCSRCNKKFHFPSTLNKHLKNQHKRNYRVNCRFCATTFKSWKEKWDHEWHAHNARNTILDCLVCDMKFRKYVELKRHCIETHRMMIPLAKNL